VRRPSEIDPTNLRVETVIEAIFALILSRAVKLSQECEDGQNAVVVGIRGSMDPLLVYHVTQAPL